jgi:hypothetical protein
MGLFTKSQSFKFKEIPSTSEQNRARNWLEGLYRKDMQFPLQGTADLTGTQQDIQTQLQGLLDQSGGDYQAVADYYRNVLNGGYDPKTSDFYQGFRQEATTLKQMGQRDVARSAQKAGMARSTPSVGMQGLVGADYDSKILQVLGGLYEQERDRQGQAAAGLPSLRGQQVGTMGAANQIAETARRVEQEKLDALYNQAFHTLLAPYTYQAKIAMALLNEPRYLGVKSGGGLTDLGFLTNAMSSAVGSYYAKT